jgi:hypothetical protein
MQDGDFGMKKLLVFLMLGLPLVSQAAGYKSSLVVQTGEFRESDLIVRTVTDLESNKICLAFYIRTTGTSPQMTCYDGIAGFRSNINQVGHFREGDLVVRKLKDSVNEMSCLVAYVSTPGTSPSIDCYKRRPGAKDTIERSGHVREGDLDVHMPGRLREYPGHLTLSDVLHQPSWRQGKHDPDRLYARRRPRCSKGRG